MLVRTETGSASAVGAAAAPAAGSVPSDLSSAFPGGSLLARDQLRIYLAQLQHPSLKNLRWSKSRHNPEILPLSSREERNQPPCLGDYRNSFREGQTDPPSSVGGRTPLPAPLPVLFWPLEDAGGPGRTQALPQPLGAPAPEGGPGTASAFVLARPGPHLALLSLHALSSRAQLSLLWPSLDTERSAEVCFYFPFPRLLLSQEQEVLGKL